MIPHRARPVERGPVPFTHGAYTLYSASVQLKTGARRRIWFFALQPPKSGRPAAKPVGYHVAVHPRTGMPFLQPDEWTANPLAVPHATSALGHKAS